jgi:hypothetical protein
MGMVRLTLPLARILGACCCCLLALARERMRLAMVVLTPPRTTWPTLRALKERRSKGQTTKERMRVKGLGI